MLKFTLQEEEMTTPEGETQKEGETPAEGGMETPETPAEGGETPAEGGMNQ